MSNFIASRTGTEYELEAKKINDGQLRVYVMPKADSYYFSGYGEWADFHQ